MASIVGTLGNDTRTGTGGVDMLDGLAGNDLLYGRGGNDALYGRAGLDRLFGEGGNDILVGGLDADFLDGGAGKDTASYADAAGPVTVDLRAGTASGGAGADTLRGIETVHGSPLEDFLFGSDGVDELRGLLGDDVLDGRGGNDRLDGAEGNDRLTGGLGNDSLIGGAGADVAVYAGNRAEFTVTTSGGTATVTDRAPTRAGNEGRDTLSGMEKIVFADGEVSLVNTPPVVQGSKTVTTLEDTNVALGITAPSDPDGNPLTITVTELPDWGKGQLLLPGGTEPVMLGGVLTPAQLTGLLFRPAADANGPAGAFAYEVTDGAATVSQRVTVAITPVDDPVTAQADSYAATEDTPLAVSAAQGVLANDRARDGGLVAVAGTFATQRGGSVVLQADGAFAYTPARDVDGTDRFTYTARDADGDSATATATFQVRGVADITITRISTAGDGTQGNRTSWTADFFPDGRKIAFGSDASNLVAGDTNGWDDIFVKDLATGAVTRVSTAADGTQGNQPSFGVDVSPDGTRIAFASFSSNLTPNDTNGASDIFVKDLASGAITRVSAALNDDWTWNSNSSRPVFSPDGQKLGFASHAPNLVQGDTNGKLDLFVANLATGAVTRVSTASDGTQSNSDNFSLTFSTDGRKVAFTSDATNLVAGDTNGSSDVFVKDLVTGAVTRVSTTATGAQADGGSHLPAFSPDGTKIAFVSGATNLVAGDTNDVGDIFVKDLATGAVTRVSTTAAGFQANNHSSQPVFSPDGTKIAFDSYASNLVPRDTNSVADVFIKDLASGAIARLSVAADGSQGNNHSGSNSYTPAFAKDGSKLAFVSGAWNLVPGDSNGVTDIFVRDLDDLFPAAAPAPASLAAAPAPDLALLVPEPANPGIA